MKAKKCIDKGVYPAYVDAGAQMLLKPAYVTAVE